MKCLVVCLHDVPQKFLYFEHQQSHHHRAVALKHWFDLTLNFCDHTSYDYSISFLYCHLFHFQFTYETFPFATPIPLSYTSNFAIGSTVDVMVTVLLVVLPAVALLVGRCSNYYYGRLCLEVWSSYYERMCPSPTDR